MTKQNFIEWAGMEKETIDFSLPQFWVDDMRARGVDTPGQFVWHYPAGKDLDGNKTFVSSSLSGVPLSIGEMAIKAIEKGNLVPKNIVAAAIEKSLNDFKEHLEQNCGVFIGPDEKIKEIEKNIMDLVKLSCENI